MQHERFHYRTLDELKRKGKRGLRSSFTLAKRTQDPDDTVYLWSCDASEPGRHCADGGADGLRTVPLRRLTVNRYVRRSRGWKRHDLV